MKEQVDKAQAVIRQVGEYVFGKEQEIREVMTAFLADGHVLLEDIPGVGKTTLANVFAKSMGMEERRIQFTPDVMPSDLTGFSVYRREEERFVYQPGSVFCNLLLADEINRASPKTQSALLEVMEERKVTVEGVTREVPKPFLVIATQNPSGSIGTNYLPEAQIDRFLISLNLGYPDYENELRMAKRAGIRDRYTGLEPVLSAEELYEMQKEAEEVFISDKVYRYVLDLVTATREHPMLERGGSPRATIALVRLARACAWLDGRSFVMPSDVAGQFIYVLSHRIAGKASAGLQKTDREELLAGIVKSTPKPVLGQRK